MKYQTKLQLGTTAKTKLSSARNLQPLSQQSEAPLQ